MQNGLSSVLFVAVTLGHHQPENEGHGHVEKHTTEELLIF